METKNILHRIFCYTIIIVIDLEKLMELEKVATFFVLMGALLFQI